MGRSHLEAELRKHKATRMPMQRGKSADHDMFRLVWGRHASILDPMVLMARRPNTKRWLMAGTLGDE